MSSTASPGPETSKRLSTGGKAPRYTGSDTQSSPSTLETASSSEHPVKASKVLGPMFHSIPIEKSEVSQDYEEGVDGIAEEEKEDVTVCEEAGEEVTIILDTQQSQVRSEHIESEEEQVPASKFYNIYIA